jgi:5-methylcytosine-specific restriction protein A
MPKPLWKRQANREHNARRRRDEPWQRWYNLARWRALRAQQLQAKPLCERCESQGRITPATVCHHVIAHKGDETLFWSGPFASSCAPCHDRDEQAIEKGGKARQVVGADGWPV